MGCQLPYTQVSWNIASKLRTGLPIFEIADGDKVVRFKETLFGHPRTWIDTVHPDPGSWDTAGDSTRLKPNFLARWSVKGRDTRCLVCRMAMSVL